MSANVRQLYLQNVPPWLDERLAYLLALECDIHAEVAYQGVRARMPSYGTDEALSAQGRDRLIRRGFFEADEAYQERLRKWLPSNRRRGTVFELLRQVRAMVSPYDVRVRVVNNGGSWYTIDPGGSESYSLGRANWDWDSLDTVFEATPWNRFWLIIYPLATGLWTDEGVWGDGDGVHWGDPGTWGTSASEAQVHSIRELVREWKPESSVCQNIIVSFDETYFDPTAAIGDPGMPDGRWGIGTAYDVGRVRRPTRAPLARYWDGTGNRTAYSGG